MNELKPCPFCGGKAELREYSCGHSGNGEFTAKYEVGCPKCKIRLSFESKFTLKNGIPVFRQNGYDKCVDTWNNRVSNDYDGFEECK